MEILYLIGNGLDIAQGLNTRYTDFYKKYSKPYDTDIAPAAKKLRSEIDKDYSTWADMESSFGKYTKDIPVNDLEDAYYDLADSLRDHLTEEQGRYKVNNQFSELAKNDLIRPYATLLERDKEEILDFITRQYIQNSPGFRININIISFNYTDIIDYILHIMWLWRFHYGDKK